MDALLGDLHVDDDVAVVQQDPATLPLALAANRLGTLAQKALLEQYGAQSFIPTTPENYGQIEEIARELGLLG